MAGEGDGPLVIARWATRASEARPPLELDGRRLPDLLTEMVHFARFVRFFDESDTESGDWEDLLSSDGTVLLALLTTMNSSGRCEAAEALAERTRETADPVLKARLLGRLLSLTFGLAEEIDRWLGSAESWFGGDGHAVVELLEAVIVERLGPLLRRLAGTVAAAEERGLLDEAAFAYPDALGRIWMMAAVVPDHGLFEGSETVWTDALIDAAAEAIGRFVQGIENVAAQAEQLIDPSLGSGEHAPHIALAIAFAKLLRHPQEKLNALPDRLADFYYRDVLRLSPLPAQMDRTYLSLKPRAGSAAMPVVEAGQAFPAGGALRFASEARLEVTGAVPASLRLWAPGGTAGRRQWLNAGDLALPADGSAGLNPFAPPALAPAEAGLVISAPLLELASGERQVTLDLVGIDLPPAMGIEQAQTLFAHAFALSFTAGGEAPGWAEPPSVEASLIEAESGWALRFQFTLDPSAPPVAAFPGSGCDAPAVRLLLKQAPVELEGLGLVWPLEVLSKAGFQSVGIRATVNGLGGLVVTAAGGPAPPVPGMAPFGSPPWVGATLRIDHPAFARPLDSLFVTLSWMALPQDPTGFGGYYSQYRIGPDRKLYGPFIDNACFKARVSGPVGPKGARSGEQRLFRCSEEGTLFPSARLDLRSEDESLNASTDFVAITLTAPPFAFGDALYPINVAHAAWEAGRDKSGAGLGRQRPREEEAEEDTPSRRSATGFWQRLVPAAEPPPALPGEGHGAGSGPDPDPPIDLAVTLPNAPYRPRLAGLQVDYKASVSSAQAPDAVTLLHATPFGGLVPLPPGVPASLLPALPSQPAFELAIDGLPPGTPLSLLFLMGPAPGGDLLTPAVEWACRRSGGSWTRLEGASISDGTAGLSTTGIVSFAPPAGEPGRIWLRAVSTGAGAAFPAIARIMADALVAVRVAETSPATFVPLAPGTVGLPKGVPGLAEVEQPLASFGGTPAETDADLPRRASERLRHKQRAVLGWDTERLVLERFPQIAAVRMIPARAPGRPNAPGHMMAIVIPEAGGPEPVLAARPVASARLKADIAQRLAAAASPFARIHVVDPNYAPLDIAVRARFTEGSGGGSRLVADLETLLAPGRGLGLPEGAGAAELEGCIAAFIRGRRYVDWLESVSVSLPEAARALPWLVPVAGTISIAPAGVDEAC